MFNLENYFIKQQEAESEAATGQEDSVESTDSQTVLTEGQDNTETEGENADNQTTDETEGKSESGDENQVPEKYEYQLPEGMELNQDLADKFSDVAKDLGLNNEQANKVVGLYAEQVENMQADYQQAWSQQVAEWETELKSDPEFGGAKFNENAEVARMAINKFGGDELKQALNDTGLGNHPAIVKFMHKVGSAIQEDSFNGSEVSAQKGSNPQGLYSKSNMNP